MLSWLNVRMSLCLPGATHSEIAMRFILFYKIELTDRYPVTTAVCCASIVYAVMYAIHALGWLQ